MNNTTELIFILDKSVSMAGLEADTIGGFNAMIEKQKREAGNCYVTTVLFSSENHKVHDRLPIEKVPAMTLNNYCVGGCTALIDAIGDTIQHIAHIHKYARKEDIPARTVFVITTDGMENASRRFSADKVRRMIQKEKEKYGWEFLFIGANIDAVETARNFGIAENRAVNYHADKKGTEVVYNAVSEAVCRVRSFGAPLASDWKKDIERDFRSRSK